MHEVGGCSAWVMNALKFFFNVGQFDVGPSNFGHLFGPLLWSVVTHNELLYNLKITVLIGKLELDEQKNSAKLLLIHTFLISLFECQNIISKHIH